MAVKRNEYGTYITEGGQPFNMHTFLVNEDRKTDELTEALLADYIARIDYDNMMARNWQKGDMNINNYARALRNGSVDKLLNRYYNRENQGYKSTPFYNNMINQMFGFGL